MTNWLCSPPRHFLPGPMIWLHCPVAKMNTQKLNSAVTRSWKLIMTLVGWSSRTMWSASMWMCHNLYSWHACDALRAARQHARRAASPPRQLEVWTKLWQLLNDNESHRISRSVRGPALKSLEQALRCCRGRNSHWGTCCISRTKSAFGLCRSWPQIVYFVANAILPAAGPGRL